MLMNWPIELLVNLMGLIAPAWADRRRLRLTMHRARFLKPPGPEAFFITATNLSRTRELTITHVWLATAPDIHIFNSDRPLPVRLRPDEPWETWIEVQLVPESQRTNLFNLARIRLSTGTIIASTMNTTVPPFGTVPGGTSR